MLPLCLTDMVWLYPLMVICWFTVAIVQTFLTLLFISDRSVHFTSDLAFLSFLIFFIYLLLLFFKCNQRHFE